MSNQIIPATGPFNAIRQTRADGSEFWSARDLLPLLGYEKWQRANDAIERACTACDNAGHNSREHFTAAGKTLRQSNQHGVFGREVLDYHLTRYACYLIAMNGDPRKSEIAAAQTYFVAQTYFAEQVQAAPALPSDPLLAQLQIMTQLREQQLATGERVSQLEQRLDAAPITSERVGVIYGLGQQLGQQMGSYGQAWHLFKGRFGLASYRDLPNSQFEEGVKFLRLQLEAYTSQATLMESGRE